MVGFAGVPAVEGVEAPHVGRAAEVRAARGYAPHDARTSGFSALLTRADQIPRVRGDADLARLRPGLDGV